MTETGGDAYNHRSFGFLDVHVHLREPGAVHKEDFISGSRAAAAGGITFMLDMPNNSIPTFTPETLYNKIRLAKENAIVDIGFHYGTDGKNTDTFKKIWDNPDVYGLKVYCNHTTGEYLIEDPDVREKIFKAWESPKPILVHAEGETLKSVIELANKYNRNLHVCHVATEEEVGYVRDAKKNGQKVTAGVCPHHLFLTDEDVAHLGSHAMMKPALGKHIDREALWKGLEDGTLDLIETDHAPHTEEEKRQNPPPSGVPGLETSLGLMLRAVHDGRLTHERVKELMYYNPKRIFNIPDQEDTYVEYNPNEPYVVQGATHQSKAKWTPFEGWELFGKVKNVVIRGRQIIKDGQFVV